MENGTPNGETAAQQPLENNTNQSAPSQGNVDTTSEQLRKEAEQARMRANQVENELRKLREEQEEAKAKELAAKEEWKALAEQREEELRRFREERDALELNQKLQAERDKVLADYPDTVKEIAAETGLTLTAFDDESVAAFKAKLDKVGEKLGTAAQVTPNNTRQSNRSQSKDELIAEFRKTGDPRVINAAIGELSFIKQFNNTQK